MILYELSLPNGVSYRVATDEKGNIGGRFSQGIDYAFNRDTTLMGSKFWCLVND